MDSKKHSLFAKIFAALLVLFVFSSPIVSASNSSLKSRQKSIQKQLEETRSKKAKVEKEETDLKKQLDEADKSLVNAQKEVSRLEKDLKKTQESKNRILRQLEQIKNNLDSLRRQLEKAKKELRRLKNIFNRRVDSIYRQGSIPYLEVFLAARNFSDFLNHLYLFGRVASQDAKLLDEIRIAKAKIKKDKKEVEAQKDKVELKKEVLANKEKRHLTLLRKQETQNQKIEKKIGEKKNLLAQVAKDRAAYEAAEEELEKSSQEIALLIQNTQSPSRQNQDLSPEKVQKSDGGLLWPTSGTITSGFGWRTHPIFKVKKFHTGVDIAAPSGQSIRAAQSGEVIFAGWKGGYGLTLVIDHGNGLSTLYAHTSLLLVQTGDLVSKGQIVAKVGATGNTTGPHLHFEVRVNGTPVNPMSYF